MKKRDRKLIKKATVYLAWHFLINHPIFKDENGLSRFKECKFEDYIKVNPKTNEIDSNSLKNTRVRVRLRCGPWRKSNPLIPGMLVSWDPRLEITTSTYEKAIVKLANRVLHYYGNGQSKGQ